MSRWSSLEVVDAASLKKVPFPKRPGDQAQPVSRQHPDQGVDGAAQVLSPMVLRDTAPTDENGTFRPQAGAASS